MNKIINYTDCPNCLGEGVIYNGIKDKYEKCDCNSFINTKKCIDYEILDDVDIEVLDNYDEEDE